MNEDTDEIVVMDPFVVTPERDYSGLALGLVALLLLWKLSREK